MLTKAEMSFFVIAEAKGFNDVLIKVNFKASTNHRLFKVPLSRLSLRPACIPA